TCPAIVGERRYSVRKLSGNTAYCAGRGMEPSGFTRREHLFRNMGSSVSKWREFAWSGLFCLICYICLRLIPLIEPGQHLRTIDIIDFVSIFNADDSFRFFLAKQAFSNIDLYSWNYYLPIAL